MGISLEREILVVVGTGGVGKTTLSAALGLAALESKERVLVVTIDPAQRLADALGLDSLTHTPQRVSGPTPGGGALWAMMLDTKRTFAELVERYLRDPESRRGIVENPIFQNLTDAVSGSREYSAIEKLFELHASGDYDLIVLDTPPATHALDFLDAPRRLSGFLDSSLQKTLLKPAVVVGRSGFRALRRGTDAVISIIQRITGLEFLQLISDFLVALEDLWEGLSQHADALHELLRSERGGFALVVQPNPVQAKRAAEFSSRLDAEGIRLDALLLNRMTAGFPGVKPTSEKTREDLCRAIAPQLPPHSPETATALADGLCDWVDATLRRTEAEEQVSLELQSALRLTPEQVCRVPRLSGELHSREALSALIPYLVKRNDRG